MTSFLPDSKSFVLNSLGPIVASKPKFFEPKTGEVDESLKLAPNAVKAAAAQVGKELRTLMSQFAAQYLSAQQLDQVVWAQLALRLGTPVEHVIQISEALGSDESFWEEVLGLRIKKALASKVFTDSNWERLESLAVTKLVNMAEMNQIRDPGELIAVARAARQSQQQPSSPQSGSTVNINFGDAAMGENGLPAAGAKMTIDLSPRAASALARKREANESGGRVIDGEMLSATELRSMLEQKSAPATLEGDES